MSDDFLGDRRMALEEAFFRKQNEKQLAELRAELAAKKSKEELRTASGVTDEAALERLVALGVSGQTLAALSLVPLIHVAWADGKMDEREREAVLMAATGKGIDAGSATYKLLEGWLKQKPDPVLFDAWRAYINELSSSLVAGQRGLLKSQILAFAQTVAESAGGFLGMKSVSAAEKAALAEIEAAFE
ncbi:MAG TPA: hypothetical protein VFU21_07075 [Kofleriaceae bacterium]|nr:hypothetical protein [Kofleriaceae bacterium]